MSTITVGTELPEIHTLIAQQDINKYADVSRDYNPIHVDEKFAAATPLGGTIAHGMLILAYISQMMTTAFGIDWVNCGKLSIRFKAPARPGDTVTTKGKVIQVDKTNGVAIVNCEVLCINQNNDDVIIGEAQVRIQN